MRKGIVIGLVALLGAIFPAIASAQVVTVTQQGDTTQAYAGQMRHAYTPQVVNNPAPEPSPWMRARVNNTAWLPNNQLVCVDAWSTTNNTKMNIGCTRTTWSTETPGWSAQEINAPLWVLGNGSYNIAYSYQSADGMWHGINQVGAANTGQGSMNTQNMGGTYVR